MAESFGARLRQQREERQIDLIAIAEQTKIKLALLDALEHDDLSHWPSGIFRRAYVRTYAQFIGLDPDVVLREFLEVHPDPGDAFTALTAAAAAAEDAARNNSAPPTRLRNIVDSAIDSLAKLRRPAANPAANNVPPPVALTPTSNGSVQTAVDLPAVPAASPEPSQPVLDLAADDRRREQVDGPDRIEAPSGDAVSLDTIAHLCVELGRVVDRSHVPPLLEESARALDAAGIIVWVWDEPVDGLRPALVHGYSEKVRVQLPTVSRNADNATAAAFRSANTCEVAATAHTTGALVIPLLTPDGCAGVLAIELQQGIQPTSTVRAAAAILAAALAQLVYRSRPVDQQPNGDVRVAAATPFLRVRTAGRHTLRG